MFGDIGEILLDPDSGADAEAVTPSTAEEETPLKGNPPNVTSWPAPGSGSGSTATSWAVGGKAAPKDEMLSEVEVLKHEDQASLPPGGAHRPQSWRSP